MTYVSSPDNSTLYILHRDYTQIVLVYRGGAVGMFYIKCINLKTLVANGCAATATAPAAHRG